METMKREDDMWVRRALGDEVMVAELILRLKQPTAAPRLAWGSRQPRSRSGSVAAASILMDNNKNNNNRDNSMMRKRRRCSPTTPLSWGSHDSNNSPTLSKDTCTNDSVAFNSANKCSKRNKSFIELQEEETRLLKEGVHLNTELEMLHVTLKKQKVKSENTTRLKTDLHQQSAKPYISEGLYFHQANGGKGSTVNYFQASNEIKAERGFVLPDLNMTPSEDDSAIDSLSGFS